MNENLTVKKFFCKERNSKIPLGEEGGRLIFYRQSIIDLQKAKGKKPSRRTRISNLKNKEKLLRKFLSE